MGKKSRRQRVPNAASRRGPTPGRSEDDVQSQPAQNEPNSQPKLTVAEAEAELRAAILEARCVDAEDSRIEVTPQGTSRIEVTPQNHPRYFAAITGLMQAVAPDIDDRKKLGQYMIRSCGDEFAGMDI